MTERQEEIITRIFINDEGDLVVTDLWETIDNWLTTSFEKTKEEDNSP